MIHYTTYVVLQLTLMGDWEKLEQPEFHTHKQAFDWVKNQLAEDWLSADNDYYVGKQLSCVDFKKQYYVGNRHGIPDKRK